MASLQTGSVQPHQDLARSSFASLIVCRLFSFFKSDYSFARLPNKVLK